MYDPSKKIPAFLLKTALYKEGCLLDFFVFRKFAEFSTVVKKTFWIVKIVKNKNFKKFHILGNVNKFGFFGRLTIYDFFRGFKGDYVRGRDRKWKFRVFSQNSQIFGILKHFYKVFSLKSSLPVGRIYFRYFRAIFRVFRWPHIPFSQNLGALWKFHP